MTDQAHLHKQLIDTMEANGSLRTQPWKQAVESVPRHVFLHSGFFRRVDGSWPTAWAPVMKDDPGWLEACYADESLVTQIAGTITPADIRGQIMRLPTSSSTLPSLVVRMLEDLQVETEHNVLEIGTGTGFSTGLLCKRLDEGRVTSVEYDDDVAARARTSLGHLGLYPTLLSADGLLGYAANAPYDRVVATCGVRTIPAAWIEQTRPGGMILSTIGGWLGSSELARLTVHDDGTATGPLLSGDVSFMLARPHMPPPLGLLPDLSAGKEREAVLPASALDHWVSRFVVQLAVPQAQRLKMSRDGHTDDVLIDVESGSWAALYEDNGRWIVRQDGPTLLWDAVEEQLGRWHAAGTPALQQFTVSVTPDRQTITW